MLKTLAVAAAVLSAATFAQPAQARDAWIPGLIIGAAGAAIVGSAIANSQPRHVYVERRCWRERRAVVNRWGEIVRYRMVRVCN